MTTSELFGSIYSQLQHIDVMPRKTQHIEGGNPRTRSDIEAIIGINYLQHNTEESEWSYCETINKYEREARQLATVGKTLHCKLDRRFVDERVSVLVETKNNFDNNTEAAKQQLQCYVELEKLLAGHNRIIAILANLDDSRIMVWKGDVCDANFLQDDTQLRSFEAYRDVFFGAINDKDAVVRATYELNELLHRYAIHPDIRSQFVGTCLLTLKYTKPEDFNYQQLTTKAIIATMEDCLVKLLEGNLYKGEKLARLQNRIIGATCIKELEAPQFRDILDKISKEILPYINDKTYNGQDILNLFFTTFNKYVGKKDKNQAFTPDHIVHFLCEVAEVNRKTRVLDPCCGSGAFLVRALTQALNDCRGNEADENEVKKSHIYGIESEDYAFGLSTTNMLIHGDGNSNVILANCFEQVDWIKDARIDVVLMNPPYNTPRSKCHPHYARQWKAAKKKGEDPTKGFHFVEYIANTVGKGKLVALLPMICAIGKGAEIKAIRRRMLQNHHLDAVFSLPDDVFHPGASVCACCMVFDLGVRHDSAAKPETFFGYFKDDGFVKRKNYGRVEKRENIWREIEAKWLDLYRKRKAERGISAVKKVTANDQWLCEAYMETDADSFNEAMLERTVRDFKAFVEQHKKMPAELNVPIYNSKSSALFSLGGKNGLFDVKLSKGDLKGDAVIPTYKQQGDELPLISAGDTSNGFIGYVDKAGDGKAEPFPGNVITVDMFCKAYYQPAPFYAVSHGRVNILIPKKFVLTPAIGLYICAAINNEQYRFNYGRGAYSGVIKELQIRLPIKKDGKPDWKSIEQLVANTPSLKNSESEQ